MKTGQRYGILNRRLFSAPAFELKIKEATIDMEEVAEKTYQLEVWIPKVDTRFTVYLIHEAGGVIVEPGPAAIIPSIQEAMKQLGMKEPSYILPTHIHIDHAGAIGSLAQLFPRAKVVVHPQVVKHAVDPSRLIESSKISFGDNFEDSYGPVLPVPESRIKAPEDGEIIPVDGRELQIIYAPGHATHHMAIFDRKTRGLFCGEALGVPPPGAESSPIPLAAPPTFDIEVYLETMERLRGLHPRILFYSHDGVGTRPEELISKAAENTRIFGDIILKAMKDGETTEAINQRIHEYITRQLGTSGEGLEMDMIVDGFIFYFKKKGLV
jgi:glyoxylase-like metal-dependent hydrolase (beta-lactamase superfamily II)